MLSLYYANYLPEVKAITESFERSVLLVTQAEGSLETSGLATQLVEIKGQYKCFVKLIEMIQSTKYVHYKRSGTGKSRILTLEKTLQH